MAVPALANQRLSPETRRGQLVAAGVELVTSRPLDQLSAEAVARAAGVSKGLVFHYFPTTRDLQVAVVRAAAADLLVRLDVGPDLPPGDRLRAGLDSFVDFIEAQPANYLAIARSAGSDPQLLAVFEETRGAVVTLVAGAIGLPDPPPGLRLVVRGWIAMVEETVLHWLDAPRGEVDKEALVGFLHRAALQMLPDAVATFGAGSAESQR